MNSIYIILLLFQTPSFRAITEKVLLTNGIQSAIRSYHSFSTGSYSPFIHMDKSIPTQLLIIKFAIVGIVIALILYFLFRKGKANSN
jgi:hypothetical protein